MGGALLLASALGLSLLTGPALAMPTRDVAVATSVTPVVPEPRKEARPVLWCDTPSQLDCVESLEFQVDGSWRTATVDNFVNWGGKRIPVLNTEGLVHEGGRTQVIGEVFERYDVDGDTHPAYQLQLQSWPQGQVLWDPPINRCEGGDPSRPGGKDPCWRAPWLADAMYRMTFRSSKLQPILAKTSLTDMQTTYAKIDGGVRFSLAGRPGASQWVLDYSVAERKDAFDALTYEWGGMISDARGANGLGGGCAGLGIITAYSNGNGGQTPRWDPRTGTLAYGIAGFHFDPDGKTYRGQAEIFIPGQLARCLWQVDPRRVVGMEIEVYTENGEETAGTKSVGYDAEMDLVKMIAIDFTYSEKQIVARSTPVAAKPGKKACDPAKVLCVTVDKARKTAKVSVSKMPGNSGDVVAVALRGSREDGNTQVTARVNKGKASFSVQLSGAKSKGQVWVLRTQSTFISSFQVA